MQDSAPNPTAYQGPPEVPPTSRPLTALEAAELHVARCRLIQAQTRGDAAFSQGTHPTGILASRPFRAPMDPLPHLQLETQPSLTQALAVPPAFDRERSIADVMDLACGPPACCQNHLHPYSAGAEDLGAARSFAQTAHTTHPMAVGAPAAGASFSARGHHPPLGSRGWAGNGDYGDAAARLTAAMQALRCGGGVGGGGTAGDVAGDPDVPPTMMPPDLTALHTAANKPGSAFGFSKRLPSGGYSLLAAAFGSRGGCSLMQTGASPLGSSPMSLCPQLPHDMGLHPPGALPSSPPSLTLPLVPSRNSKGRTTTYVAPASMMTPTSTGGSGNHAMALAPMPEELLHGCNRPPQRPDSPTPNPLFPETAGSDVAGTIATPVNSSRAGNKSETGWGTPQAPRTQLPAHYFSRLLQALSLDAATPSSPGGASASPARTRAAPHCLSHLAAPWLGGSGSTSRPPALKELCSEPIPTAAAATTLLDHHALLAASDLVTFGGLIPSQNLGVVSQDADADATAAPDPTAASASPNADGPWSPRVVRGLVRRASSASALAPLCSASLAAITLLPQPSMVMRMLETQGCDVDPLDIPALLPNMLLASHSLDLLAGPGGGSTNVLLAAFEEATAAGDAARTWSPPRQAQVLSAGAAATEDTHPPYKGLSSPTRTAPVDSVGPVSNTIGVCKITQVSAGAPPPALGSQATLAGAAGKPSSHLSTASFVTAASMFGSMAVAPSNVSCECEDVTLKIAGEDASAGKDVTSCFPNVAIHISVAAKTVSDAPTLSGSIIHDVYEGGAAGPEESVAALVAGTKPSAAQPQHQQQHTTAAQESVGDAGQEVVKEPARGKQPSSPTTITGAALAPITPPQVKPKPKRPAAPKPAPCPSPFAAASCALAPDGGDPPAFMPACEPQASPFRAAATQKESGARGAAAEGMPTPADGCGEADGGPGQRALPHLKVAKVIAGRAASVAGTQPGPCAGSSLLAAPSLRMQRSRSLHTRPSAQDPWDGQHQAGRHHTVWPSSHFCGPGLPPLYPPAVLSHQLSRGFSWDLGGHAPGGWGTATHVRSAPANPTQAWHHDPGAPVQRQESGAQADPWWMHCMTQSLLAASQAAGMSGFTAASNPPLWPAWGGYCGMPTYPPQPNFMGVYPCLLPGTAMPSVYPSCATPFAGPIQHAGAGSWAHPHASGHPAPQACNIGMQRQPNMFECPQADVIVGLPSRGARVDGAEGVPNLSTSPVVVPEPFPPCSYSQPTASPAQNTADMSPMTRATLDPSLLWPGAPPATNPALVFPAAAAQGMLPAANAASHLMVMQQQEPAQERHLQAQAGSPSLNLAHIAVLQADADMAQRFVISPPGIAGAVADDGVTQAPATATHCSSRSCGCDSMTHSTLPSLSEASRRSRRHTGSGLGRVPHSSREHSPYRGDAASTCSSSARTDGRSTATPVAKLSWCHVQHSKKQAPELSADEVKELVKVQLKSGKPVRAPWYRGEAVANATLKPSPSPELRSSITGPSPAPASTAGGKSPTPKGTGFFCPM